MATSVGRADLDLGINYKQFSKELKNIGPNATSMIRNQFGKLGGIAAAAFSAKALFDFSRSAINLSSDLEEVQNVVDVTFGEMSNQINSFSKNAINQFGLSELSAKKYTSTMGAMLKSSGLTGQAVTSMSIDMAQLTADMASFYNLDYDEAFNKIRAGISGETEPLKQLGVNLNVANLEAYALSQGMKASYNSMSQAEQVMLRYNYLLHVTKDAQGDFARTSHTWANQIKLLGEQWRIFMGTMGSAFISILTPIVRGLNSLIAKLQVAALYFKAFVEMLFGKATSDSNITKEQAAISAGNEGIASTANDAANNISKVGKAAKKAANEARGLSGFDELNILQKPEDPAGAAGGADGIGGIGGAAGAFEPIDFNPIEDMEFAISDSIKNIVEKVKSGLNSVKDFISGNKGSIIALAAGIGTGLLTYLGSGTWDKIVLKAGKAKKAIIAGLKAMNLPLLGAAAFVALLTTAIIELWNENEDFRKAVKNIWGNIKSIISSVWNSVLKPIFGLFVKMLKEIWTEGLKPLWEKFKDFINQIVQLIAVWLEAMTPVFKWIVETFGPVIVEVFATLFNKIKNAVMQIIDVVAGLISAFTTIIKGVKDIFTGFIDFIVGVFTGDWNRAFKGITTTFNGLKTTASGVWSGIKSVFSVIPNWFKSTFTKAWDNVKKVFSTGGKIFTGIKDGIVSTFRTIVNGLINGINRIIRIPFNAINNMLNKIRNIGIFNLKPFQNLWGYNPLKVPQIPKLAQGGYVTANSPMLAMIGDNKREGEIVAPESKIYEQTYKAIADALSSNQANPSVIELIIQLGGTTIFKEIIDGINKIQRQEGKALIKI